MLKITRAVISAFAALSLSCQAMAQGEDDVPLEELGRLVEVYGLIKTGYVAEVDDEKLVAEALSGMLASLDPHSRYLGKEEMAELESDTIGKYVGVGIETEADDKVVRVIAAVEHSPADRAGIRPGDVIVQVDGKPVQGMSMEQIARRVRGQPHTSVTLAIARQGDGKNRTVSMLREELQEQTVKVKMIRPGFLWVRVSHFQQATVDELIRKINEACASGESPAGLVLDLRSDPGGLVSTAVGVAAAFLPKDAVVFSTRGRLPQATEVIRASPRYYTANAATDPLEKLHAGIKTVPMAVLINGGSASASEIVAGALQDHQRATVMGTQSFGKGSVQAIKRISDSAGIKLTVARYYTPLGRSIQAKGITPDIVFMQSSGDGSPLREADLRGHLENDQEMPSAGSGQQATRASPATPETAEPESGFGSAADLLLTQAIDRLQGLPPQAGAEIRAGMANKAE